MVIYQESLHDVRSTKYKILIICSSLNVTDEVSHPCKVTENYNSVYFNIYILESKWEDKTPHHQISQTCSGVLKFFRKDQPKTNNLVKDDNDDLFPFAHNILNYLQIAFCQLYHISHLVAMCKNVTSMRWVHLTFSFAVFIRAYKWKSSKNWWTAPQKFKTSWLLRQEFVHWGLYTFFISHMCAFCHNQLNYCNNIQWRVQDMKLFVNCLLYTCHLQLFSY